MIDICQLCRHQLCDGYLCQESREKLLDFARKQAAREPLVQEVIRLSNYYEAVLRGDEIWDGRAPSAQLRDACRKLAEWRP